MSSTAVKVEVSTGSSTMRAVDMTIEALVIPVSDVDRAKEFYANLDWRLDADVSAGDLRLIQFTPGLGVFGPIRRQADRCGARFGPGRLPCRVRFGVDAQRARGTWCEGRRHLSRGSAWCSIPRDGSRRRSAGGSLKLWLVCQVQRPRRQCLASPGGHDSTAGSC